MSDNMRTIRVESLARVEGEGSLTVRLDGSRATEVQLGIFEPPRFFEALLRGRSYHEAPDITSRICGICPAAYLMSACHAMEDALGMRIDGQLRAVRRSTDGRPHEHRRGRAGRRRPLRDERRRGECARAPA